MADQQKRVVSEEWAELGEQLRELDEAKFKEALQSLRDLVDAQRILQRFDWQLMFRGRPRKRYYA